MLLPSGADAAYALAEDGPGIGAFIAKMNAVAHLLGMTRTHFSNFDGLPYPHPVLSNHSTAANLLTLGRAAMRSAVFRSIVDQRTYRITAGSGHHAYLWRNLNPLLGYYPGAIGIKPGYTGAAGQCLLFRGHQKRPLRHRRHAAQRRFHQRPQPSRRHPHPELGVELFRLNTGPADGMKGGVFVIAAITWVWSH